MKKIVLSLTIILTFLTIGLTPVYANEIDSKNINSKITTVLDGADAPSDLFDGSMYTKYTPDKDAVLTIESVEKIGYVYIKFNKPPSEYQVDYDELSETYGQYGFLHELISLPLNQKRITIHLPNVQICDIYVYSPGMLPNDVEQWQPPHEDCDILLLPTHADDEHLFFGSIMPYYAGQLNKKVQVAYLTNHWGEWYRPHELLGGLWEAGVKAYPVISEFNDYYSESLEHAKTLYDNDKMLGYEVELIRRFKPEVVIGHDINGEYGHGVHMLNTYLLKQAIEISDDKNYYPESAQKYGTFEVQKTYLHLYDKNTITLDVDTPLSAFSGKTAFEKAEDAFAHHQSQQKWFTVQKKGVYDLRKFGLYKTTVGYDTGNDILENVIFSDEVKEIESSDIESIQQESSETVSSDIQTKPENKTDFIKIVITVISTGIIVSFILALIIMKMKKKREYL